jgi:hypothetical protein
MPDPNNSGSPQIDPKIAAKLDALSQSAPNYANAAYSSMNSPAAQTVPQPSGVIDSSLHPALAKIISIIANAAQSYGWTSMPPQQRMQAQEMEQQKAEAMARLGQGQQQLGLEGQRVGIEQGRLGEEQARTKIEAKRQQQESTFQTGQLAESSKRTSVEQQRADAEHTYQTGMLANAGKQLEEQVRFHNQQGTLEQNRINLEKSSQDLMKQRMQIEEDHFNQQIRMQGLTFNKQVAEDERKQLHTSLDEWAKSNSWSTWLQGKDYLMQQHQSVDNFIDDKLRQVTGPTPFPAGSTVTVQPSTPAGGKVNAPRATGGMPAGATHTALGSDGKMHYTNAKGQDLGPAE